jgi:hypothetical protein
MFFELCHFYIFLILVYFYIFSCSWTVPLSDLFILCIFFYIFMLFNIPLLYLFISGIFFIFFKLHYFNMYLLPVYFWYFVFNFLNSIRPDDYLTAKLKMIPCYVIWLFVTVFIEFIQLITKQCDGVLTTMSETASLNLRKRRSCVLITGGSSVHLR